MQLVKLKCNGQWYEVIATYMGDDGATSYLVEHPFLGTTELVGDDDIALEYNFNNSAS